MTDLATGAGELVRQTREKLMPHWGNVEVARHKGGGVMDVVTKLDMEVEQFLTEELKKIDPGIEFAGEEFGGTREAERFWLCDPIDGTVHFIRGTPFCTVMLALIERGQVALSYIYDFVNDRLYHAQRGNGAYCNKERIHVSGRPLTEAYLGWEINITNPGRLEKYLELKERAPLFKALCAGYEFTLVASGKLEGRVQFDPWGKDWDFAPGSLLVEEAGGVVANVGKRSFSFANLDSIMANKKVYDALTSGPDALFPITED